MSRSLSFPTFVWLVWVLLLSCASTDSAPHEGLNVQPGWQSARLSRGHQEHVSRQHIACAQCHDLGGASVPVPSSARCAACHEKESRIQHAEGQAERRFGHPQRADCTLCHAFAGSTATSVAAVSSAASGAVDAGPRATQPSSHADLAARDCVRCHAQKQGNLPAIVVHASAACVSCHRPHDDAEPKPGACVSCHQEIETQHAAHGKSAIQICTTCHQHQHAPAADARESCTKCHATEPPIVPKSALFAGGHSACTGCHQPHQFAKSAVVSCRSCHGGIHVLGEASVLAHKECSSCHSPHDVKGTPQSACANCHQNIHPDHPKAAQGSCTGCHEPHPAAAEPERLAVRCSNCHRTAHSDQAFHQGVECRSCHQPHAFALGQLGNALCSRCHAQELTRVSQRAGHQQCARCHTGLPHQPAASLAVCASCHAREQQLLNTGHTRCTNCHEPHSGGVATACQSCHQVEAKSAPSGHARCTNCHEPHSGSRANAPACTTCHLAEGASKHASVPGGCTTCHSPHGPKPTDSTPACSTCHAPAQLPGLHQRKEHQECRQCHSGHGDQSGLGRALCVGCHSDRKTHFPAAARCANCHVFEQGAARGRTPAKAP